MWKVKAAKANGLGLEMTGRVGWLLMIAISGSGRKQSESKSPGIGQWVEQYLGEVFEVLGFERKS